MIGLFCITANSLSEVRRKVRIRKMRKRKVQKSEEKQLGEWKGGMKGDIGGVGKRRDNGGKKLIMGEKGSEKNECKGNRGRETG